MVLFMYRWQRIKRRSQIGTIFSDARNMPFISAKEVALLGSVAKPLQTI